MASNRIWGDRGEKIVILDSSAIMMLFEFPVNLEDQLTELIGKHHIIVPKPIVKELMFLSQKGKGKQKTKAKAALKIIEKYDVVDVNNNSKGDESVLSLAEKLDGIVVTNDHELRRRVKRSSLHVVFLRGKGKLVIE